MLRYWKYSHYPWKNVSLIFFSFDRSARPWSVSLVKVPPPPLHWPSFVGFYSLEYRQKADWDDDIQTTVDWAVSPRVHEQCHYWILWYGVFHYLYMINTPKSTTVYIEMSKKYSLRYHSHSRSGFYHCHCNKIFRNKHDTWDFIFYVTINIWFRKSYGVMERDRHSYLKGLLENTFTGLHIQKAYTSLGTSSIEIL